MLSSRPQKRVSKLQSNTCSEGQMSTMSINRALKQVQRSETSRADKHTSNKTNVILSFKIRLIRYTILNQRIHLHVTLLVFRIKDQPWVRLLALMESNVRWNQLSISEVNEFTFHQKDCQTEENEMDKHPPTLPWIQSVCCVIWRECKKSFWVRDCWGWGQGHATLLYDPIWNYSNSGVRSSIELV